VFGERYVMTVSDVTQGKRQRIPDEFYRLDTRRIH